MEDFYKDRRSMLIIGLGFIAAGIIHWTIPYGEMDMLSQPFILKWSISALLIGAAGVSVIRKAPLSTSIFTTSGFILAVIFRVLYDTTFIDSTSHNLWPFEVLISILIAFPASLIGSVVSSLLIKSFSKKRLE